MENFETGYTAEEITNKTKGFEFLANVNTSDILRWNLKNLAAKNK